MKQLIVATVAILIVTALNVHAEEEGKKKAEEKKTPKSVHELKVKTLEGKELELSKYKGNVLLIVNVASECGATPQYRQLQAMSDKYSDKGLIVLGFPCNQFGAQEPGDATQIRQFCTREYAVKFPMFAKVDVNGSGQSPLYEFLKSDADDHSDISWNFEKFLVRKDGKVAARFDTATTPDAPEVVTLLEEELQK